MNKDGATLSVRVSDFGVMQAFLNRCVAADIVRCSSANKRRFCGNSATHLHWHDRSEWYPLCDKHRKIEPQWAGSGNFEPHRLVLTVIKEKAEEWLKTLNKSLQDKIEVDYYIM